MAANVQTLPYTGQPANAQTLPYTGQPTDIHSLAAQYAGQYNIPPWLFNALINQESGWDVNAGSPAGAQGLTQLMPGTAAGLGVTNIRDPAQNLQAGAKYLSQQYQQFGSWPLALAAYNAGPGAVQKYGGVPPYAETQNYVKTIMGQQGNNQLPPAQAQAAPAAQAAQGLQSLLQGFGSQGFTSPGYSSAGMGFPSYQNVVPAPSYTSVGLGMPSFGELNQAPAPSQSSPVPQTLLSQMPASVQQGLSNLPSQNQILNAMPSWLQNMMNSSLQQSHMNAMNAVMNATQDPGSFQNMLQQQVQQMQQVPQANPVQPQTPAAAQPTQTHTDMGKLAVPFEGSSLQGTNETFAHKVAAAAQAAGATQIKLTSAYRSPEHNAAVGGVSRSNHMFGHAFDGHALIPGQGWVPLGDLPTLSQFGLRGGDQPGFYRGGRDPVHVDDAYNQR